MLTDSVTLRLRPCTAVALVACAFALASTGCGTKGGGNNCGNGSCNGNSNNNNGNNNNNNNNNGAHGSVHGRLAAPAVQPTRVGPSGLFGHGPWYGPGAGGGGEKMSLDEVTVDLLKGDASSPPDSWPVDQTATPDASGVFAFEDLPEGDYALKVNQPEFATVAYRVDSTDFHLSANQTVSLILPLITTLEHGMTDPWLESRLGGPPQVTTALDIATGEIAVASSLGLAFVDPDRGTMDVLFSRNFFPGGAVLALAPTTQVAWLLYSDRLVRIDRSIFTDPEASEALNLDDAATRLALGDKVRFAMLPAPGGYGGCYFEGERYFSPDEQILYASTQSSGVMVIDLVAMKIVRVIMGRVIGYNPVSNHLFFSNGQWGGNSGTEVLVVDASTRMEVNVVELDNVRGVAPVPGDAETVMVGSKLSTADAQIPFIKVVDASGAVVVDERAKDYLGLDYDPAAGAPSFDLTGQYFMLGSAAFRILEGGGFEAVTPGIGPGRLFNDRVAQCNMQRAVDPVHLYELWYGCWQSDATVGLISLDQTNVPVAVRPGTAANNVLLDQTRGRAIFWSSDKLVLVHYADPAAAALPEVVDLSAVVTPFVPAGAICSSANPCSGTDVCVGATDTAYTGRCLPNPRLPYLPFCGGFTQATCDEGFTCTTQNPTNPNSFGQCGGLPDRDYAAHGPACGAGLPCPAGMSCNAGNHCEPKPCVTDADCAAYPGEICGSVQNLGRVCLTPGALPDGALCLASEECLHGTCIPVKGAAAMGSGTGDLRFGPLGLMECTTPCYETSDCPGGALCMLDRPRPDLAPSYIGPDIVWDTHRVAYLPYCRPADLGPVDDCDGVCAGEQVCVLANSNNRCQTGFEPLAWVDNGLYIADYCLPPARSSFGPTCAFGCTFPCKRGGDCPFETQCVGGSCSLPFMGNPLCAAACGADESCASFDCSFESGFCVSADACAGDADCGGTTGACLHSACIGPSRGCTDAGDCNAGEECVQRWSDPSECLPAFCGCTGAEASRMACKQETSTCYIPGACTDLPCDGTILTDCSPTVPVPEPIMCVCPSCSWNDIYCPGTGAVPFCPADFTCTHLGQMSSQPHLGQDCTCNAASCQTP